MHELGLINYVVDEVSRIAEEQNVKKIRSVTLQFGEVSGIVTSYLHDYWLWYTRKFPMFDGAKLKTEEIPAVTWCDDCKITYSTVTYGKTCPHCGSGRTWLLRGNEMMIKEVEVEDEDGTEVDADGISGYEPDTAEAGPAADADGISGHEPDTAEAGSAVDADGISGYEPDTAEAGPAADAPAGIPADDTSGTDTETA